MCVIWYINWFVLFIIYLKKYYEFPASVAELEAAEPVYEYMPGWKSSTCDARCAADLPENARKYLARMAELVDSTVAIISVGPRRDQTFPADAE